MKIIAMFLFANIFIFTQSWGVNINTNGYTDEFATLRNEIKHLENELDRKTKQLNKCAKKNKNFQIAGIATIGLATAGVATNIALNDKIKNQQKQNANLINKIKLSNENTTLTLSEIEKMKQNVDEEKFQRIIIEKTQKEFTESELLRMQQLNIDWDDDNAITNLSASDKKLVERAANVTYNSLKESQKENQ